ncbi:c-type cytochrome [Bosea vestrisii]|uniref:C-type cytochrome n=1 Tax=Bosea vestrisii TaxID=151416 RepID=A0ABW0HGR3_9HYPH
MRAASAALVAFCVIAGGAVQAQEPVGAAIFKTCQPCHSLDPAQAGMAGPHLAKLGGRVLGSAEGFDYSPAFRAAKARGLAWDRERLLSYLADPDAVVPGGWMSLPAGVSAADRAAVTDYLLGK